MNCKSEPLRLSPSRLYRDRNNNKNDDNEQMSPMSLSISFFFHLPSRVLSYEKLLISYLHFSNFICSFVILNFFIQSLSLLVVFALRVTVDNMAAATSERITKAQAYLH